MFRTYCFITEVVKVKGEQLLVELYQSPTIKTTKTKTNT